MEILGALNIGENFEDLTKQSISRLQLQQALAENRWARMFNGSRVGGEGGQSLVKGGERCFFS